MSLAEVTRLQNDPILHVKSVQGVTTLQDYQERILDAIHKHDRVAISACHCIGKTWTLAHGVLWLLPMFPGAKIITTAPSHMQVESLLWSEIREGHRKSTTQLGGSMLNTSWKIRNDWFAIGMSPRENAGTSADSQGSESRFQGFHGDPTVIIFDEATGVSPVRWLQKEGMLTGGNSKFIAIGNPTTKHCEFFRCFQDPTFFKIKLTCFDSPNLKANQITNKMELINEIEFITQMDEVSRLKRIAEYKVVESRLLTLQWVIQAALKWGIDHPLFISKALGEFPEEDERNFMTMALVQAAQLREANRAGVRSIGVDPARFGTDSTVITGIEGHQQFLYRKLKKFDTAAVTGEIVNIVNSLERRKKEIIAIDATGLGSGVYDQLKERRSQGVIPDHIQLREIHFGAACPREDDRKKYANLKAKIFVELADSLKNGLGLIQEHVYLEELPTIRYGFDSKGRYVIESKDDYKKRTGLGSPDSADSLAIADYGRHDVYAIGDFSENMMTSTNSEVESTTLVGSRYAENW